MLNIAIDNGKHSVHFLLEAKVLSLLFVPTWLFKLYVPGCMDGRMDLWLIINIVSAKDSLEFLVRWLNRFPWYKTRDIFITGESYAGHYVPQLAREILAYNAKSSHPIHLKGIMVTSSAFSVVLFSRLVTSLPVHFVSTTHNIKTSTCTSCYNLIKSGENLNLTWKIYTNYASWMLFSFEWGKWMKCRLAMP